MCSDNYCRGYRVAARMKRHPDSATFHAGFRCVRSPEASGENTLSLLNQ